MRRVVQCLWNLHFEACPVCRTVGKEKVWSPPARGIPRTEPNTGLPFRDDRSDGEGRNGVMVLGWVCRISKGFSEPWVVLPSLQDLEVSKSFVQPKRIDRSCPAFKRHDGLIYRPRRPRE